MSLREHFSELKRRAKIVFISFAILFVAFLAVPANPGAVLGELTGGGGTYVPLIAFFMARVKLELLPPGWELIGLNVNAALEVYLIACVVFAFIFNSPITAYEVIMFINPALKENEKKLIFPFVGAATALFVGGALFGFFFLAHFLLIALGPFFGATGLNPVVSGLDFYTIVVITVGMSAIAFTIPVYVYTLIRLGVLKAATFRKNRIVIWAVTYILCAIVTPDGGPLLDILLFLPIIVLLELSVFLGGRSAAGKEKKDAAAAAKSGGAPSSAPPPPPPPPTTPSLPPPGPRTPSLPPASTLPFRAAIPTSPIPVVNPLSGPPVMKKYCAYCLKEMPMNAMFCPSCGKSND
jgi:sec-independent protein translocase protein TatC